MSDREYLIRSLASQVLNHPDARDQKVSPGIHDAADARVDVEIRGVVHNIRRQIWIDSGALNEKISVEIERQASEIDLNELIRRTVMNELSRTEAQVEQQIRTLVRREVEHRTRTYAQDVAKRVADRLLAVDLGAYKEDEL